MIRCLILVPSRAQDFPFNLDDATGRLALRYDEGSLRVSVEDMKSIQRKDIAPWLMAVPTLFDSKVRGQTCVVCMSAERSPGDHRHVVRFWY